MFTKGTLYFLIVTLSGIASMVMFGIALAKSKTKPPIARKAALALGILLLIISVYTGIDLTLKAYYKIRTTAAALKNFPETVGSETNKDTTDYIRTLKRYEPKRFNGKVPRSFYTEYGFYDWWRFPLVYPYSIYCIDVLEMGRVANDSGITDFEQGGPVNAISTYFDRFTFDENYFVGITAPTSGANDGADEYFILSFQNGKTDKFTGRENLMKKLENIGFNGNREFIPVRKYSERF